MKQRAAHVAGRRTADAGNRSRADVEAEPILVDQPSIGLTRIMMEAVMERFTASAKIKTSRSCYRTAHPGSARLVQGVYILRRGRIVESIPARSALTGKLEAACLNSDDTSIPPTGSIYGVKTHGPLPQRIITRR